MYNFIQKPDGDFTKLNDGEQFETAETSNLICKHAHFVFYQIW